VEHKWGKPRSIYSCNVSVTWHLSWKTFLHALVAFYGPTNCTPRRLFLKVDGFHFGCCDNPCGPLKPNLRKNFFIGFGIKSRNARSCGDSHYRYRWTEMGTFSNERGVSHCARAVIGMCNALGRFAARRSFFFLGVTVAALFFKAFMFHLRATLNLNQCESLRFSEFSMNL